MVASIASVGCGDRQFESKNCSLSRSPCGVFAAAELRSATYSRARHHCLAVDRSGCWPPSVAPFRNCVKLATDNSVLCGAAFSPMEQPQLTVVLRVCPESSIRIAEFSEHEAD